MKKILIVKVLVCVFSFGGMLYAYLDQQNDLTKLRIELPELAREVRVLEEDNSRLRYEIEQFENPKHLMELAKRPEFSHLKYPIVDEVLVVNPTPSEKSVREEENNSRFLPRIPKVMMGAKIIE